MMKARTRIAIALSSLLITQQALALGLGQARIESDMSAPLRLSIPIAGFAGSGIEFEELQVNVPGYVDQTALGIPDLVLPQGIKTVLAPDGRGGAVVRISTRTAVREPVLRFALRASWPGGEVVKSYELIIDPPYVAYPRTSSTTTIAVRPSTSPAAQQPSPRARPTTASVSATAGTSFGPIAEGGTLYPIARSAYPQLAARLPQVMAVIVERNPDAFVGGSADQLLRGAVLALPATNDMRQALAATSQSATRNVSDSAATYTVAEGDTLYTITRRELGVGEELLPATVARIYASNPQAFVDGDINRLQVGALLQLEGNASGALTDATTQAPVAAPVAQPITQTATPTTIQAPAATPAQTPDTVSASEVSELSAQLTQAEANLAAQRQVQTDLNARLSELTETLRSLRERDARIGEQSDALSRELQSTRETATAPSSTAQQPATAAVTSDNTVAQVATPQPTAPTPVVTQTTPAAAAPKVVPPRTAPAAQQSGVMSFVESLISGPAMWIGAGALILALLAGVFALLRRRKVAAVATQPRAGGADEDATRDKLAEVRQRFTESGRFIAEPLQDPSKDGDSKDVHMTDAAHASRYAKEAAVHLAYGDLPAARHGIEEAIRLDPHRDEHKMVLVTVLEGMGEQAKAREIIDEMLTRREELSGELRSQVEQLKKKTAG